METPFMDVYRNVCCVCIYNRIANNHRPDNQNAKSKPRNLSIPS